MIRLVETRNFRCLRYIRRSLENFHVLVGPNASGKTTFLDVVAFMGQLVSEGLEAAVEERTSNFQDLVWQRSQDCFELAVEFEIPPERRRLLERSMYGTVRYEICIGPDTPNGQLSILAEKVVLKEFAEKKRPSQHHLFPMEPNPPETITTPRGKRNTQTVVNKSPGGNDNFYDETGKGWDHAFKLVATNFLWCCFGVS